VYRHIVRALATTLAVSAVALAAAAPRAAANENDGSGYPACNDDGWARACLDQFQYVGYLWYNGSASLHLNMPQQYAQDIVNCGGPFYASLWGNDDGAGIDDSDDFLRNMVVAPGWPRADASGLEVHFYTLNINVDDLDEDDGRDELYVRTSYFDCHTGLTSRTFISSNILGNWPF
jgi:hypothetical protein